MRLDRFLHEAGLGTRREVNALVRAGRVTVDGDAAPDGARHLAEGARVACDGRPVALRGPRTIAFHKPPGLVTAARDALPTIYDALPFDPRELQPVGRLDRETEGLLLLTDDGQLLHRLTDPKRHVEKEYVAHLKRAVESAALARLRGSLDIGRGERSQAPIAVEPIAPDVLRLVITEGKYHQVRRMVFAVGHEVVRLVRMRVGGISLGDLAPGAHRDLTAEEVESLRRAVKLPVP